MGQSPGHSAVEQIEVQYYATAYLVEDQVVATRVDEAKTLVRLEVEMVVEVVVVVRLGLDKRAVKVHVEVALMVSNEASYFEKIVHLT